MAYSRATRDAYVTIALVLRRAGVPEGVLRGTMSQLVLHRRVSRAAHPTRRKGHPLPAIVTALFYATPLRRDLLRMLHESSDRRMIAQITDAATHEPLRCRDATIRLAEALEKMLADDGDATGGVSLAAWAAELEALAAKADVDVPLYAPADWYRLANVVLTSLPTALTEKHLGGFTSVHRYAFSECQHELEEVDDSALVQSASAAGTRSLLEALTTERPPVPVRAIQCPLCHRVGRMTHAETPVSRLARDSPPTTLWILLFRNDPQSSGLLRHAVDFPLELGIDANGALTDRCRRPDHHDIVYYLYAVLVYFSNDERSNPPPEFEGDSGGRFSLCVYFGPDDGFYWIQDQKPAIPLRGPQATTLLHNHSHAALYSAEPPDARAT